MTPGLAGQRRKSSHFSVTLALRAADLLVVTWSFVKIARCTLEVGEDAQRNAAHRAENVRKKDGWGRSSCIGF
jgi:hypothetical protein